MKRLFVISLALIFTLGIVCLSVADDSKMLKANEKKMWEKAVSAIPPERQLNVAQFKKLYDNVVAGKEKAYLVDTRSHPEFYAFHIPYTDIQR